MKCLAGVESDACASGTNRILLIDKDQVRMIRSKTSGTVSSDERMAGLGLRISWTGWLAFERARC